MVAGNGSGHGHLGPLLRLVSLSPSRLALIPAHQVPGIQLPQLPEQRPQDDRRGLLRLTTDRREQLPVRATGPKMQ